MAKDGTLRGGARPGAGAIKKALTDRILEGNPSGHPIEVLDFGDITELQGAEMPKPSALLSAEQKDGSKLEAVHLYEKTWQWLDERGCAHLISPDLLERYAMSAARWIQCENAVSRYGFLAKHPTTGNPIQSPYVAMAQSYMAQTNRLWMEIFQIVKENCTTEYKGANPQQDLMEMLLQQRE